jgi:hypothetical protein
MPSVYLESTIPSYLTSRPSRDLIVAAHQQITHDWWEHAAECFDLFVSEAVLEEIGAGDPTYAAKRLALVAPFPVLKQSDDVDGLIREYARRLAPAGVAIADLPHFAFAVAYKMDFVVTWNCAHIANGQIIRRLAAINDELGQSTPIIVTPQELMTSFPGVEP